MLFSKYLYQQKCYLVSIYQQKCYLVSIYINKNVI